MHELIGLQSIQLIIKRLPWAFIQLDAINQEKICDAENKGAACQLLNNKPLIESPHLSYKRATSWHWSTQHDPNIVHKSHAYRALLVCVCSFSIYLDTRTSCCLDHNLRRQRSTPNQTHLRDWPVLGYKVAINPIRFVLLTILVNGTARWLH